jgi:hypothetical protein
MRCTEARAALPLLIYGDAGPQEQAALREHLGHCADCRREQQVLENVRRLLDAAAAPRVELDLPQLHRSLADRQLQKARRWRRIAIALGGVAALLLFAVGLRLEVRLEPGRIVVCWGDPPSAVLSGATGVLPVDLDRQDAGPAVPPETIEAELRVLRELIHALKQDADDRDQNFGDRLDRLQRHVQILQAQADQRWSATEQDVAALYLLSRKGEKP